jgi:hypothetical protein
MPAFYKIAKDRRLVLSTASGVFTLADVLAHQDQILADPDFNPSYSQLLDLTHVTKMDLSAEDICKLAERDIFLPAIHSNLPGLGPVGIISSSIIGYTPCTDGLAIPEEKRGQRGWQKRLSASFAYASLVCSLSFWLLGALYYVQVGLRARIPGWRWVDSIVSWQWVLFHAFALLLAIVAAAIGFFFSAKLWRIALPVALLTFLLTYYVMVS